MRPLRLIIAVAAGAYAFSQYWQERRRLAQMRGLPARVALARHERMRKKAERTLTMVTGAVCLLAAALAVYGFGVLPNAPASRPSAPVKGR